MNDFLGSLKADLLDRRLLPLVALVGLALVAALGYAVFGGGSPSAPSGVVAAPTPGPSGIAVTQSTSQGQPVAETTDGATDQHRGFSHNPFSSLVRPSTVAHSAQAQSSASSARASASAPTTNSGAGSTTSSGSTAQGSGGSTPTTPPSPSAPSKPPAPAKPTAVYHVAVEFGVVPPGTPVQLAQLTPYESLKLLTPLPSAQQPLLVFRGVTNPGKSATFTLVGEAILQGGAACLPSASHCQAIDVKPGGSEQLKYLSANGETITYELRVVSIVATTASKAAAKGVVRGESRAGREVLRRNRLVAVPDLHYSSQVGVLVFAAHPGSGARARAAARWRHRR
jgi:hypothetical protein